MDSYVLMFSEVANDFQVELAPVFNVSQPGNIELNISRTVTSADSLLLGRQYNVTIIASNTAGTSSSVRTICKCRLKVDGGVSLACEGHYYDMAGGQRSSALFIRGISCVLVFPIPGKL